MIRRGRFARWKGNEYEISSRDRQIFLTTTDTADLENGFSPIGGARSSYVRPVDTQELDDAYEIIPYAILEGHRFAIEGMDCKTGLVKLVTHNPFAAKKVDVRPYGSDAYMIELPLQKVTIEEDRIPILGFENRLA